MNRLYTLGVVLISSYIIEAMVVPNGHNLTASEQEFLSKAFDQMLKIDTKIGKSGKLLQSYSSHSTVRATFSSSVYTDTNCKSPKVTTNKNYTKTGTIQDNTITFQSTQSQNGSAILGEMIISSILPDLPGFQVFLSSFRYIDQFEFLFTGNQIRCNLATFALNVNKTIIQICMQSVNMIRSKGNISSCFIGSATALSSNYVDINSINVINEMRTDVIDFGCYSATGNDISYRGQNSESTKHMHNMMKTIVTPLHKEMCNYSDRNMPTISITLVTIAIVLSNIL